jgi:uncharacterized protein (TIGR03000 family)
MIRPTWKHLLVGAILTATLTMGASRANAYLGWRHWGVAYGWCDSCFRVPYYPCCGWYSAWRPAFRPVYYRTAWYRPWHWCSRCCAWCQTCGCDSWACGSLAYDSCGWSGSAIAPQDATMQQQSEPTRAPLKPQPGAGEPKPSGSTDLPGPGKADTPTKPAAPEAKTGLQASDSGVLTIQVPEGAKVFINGLETRSQGTRRQYLSAGLVPGKVYPYAVTVMIPRASQGAVDSATPQLETRVETVYLKAGEHLSLNFDRSMKTVLVAGGR